MTTTYAVVITLYLFLYFMGHISQSAGIKYERHKNELERYVNSESFKAKILNQELEKDALKWEQIIHGKLQSKVISGSLKKVSVEDRVSADDRFIAEVSDLISESLSASLEKESNLTQIGEEVCRPWNAVIDIQSEIDPSIAKQTLSPHISKRVHDVLQEAITNAVKHGGAEKVWLVIKAGLNNSLQILVKNDGSPVGKPKRRRIGTNLFNQSGEWSIGNENGLVVFQIQIDA
jgi:signal transduction histidine kinase